MKAKGLITKLIVIGIIIAVIFAGWLFDYERSKKYSITITEISNENPVASNKERVEITFLVAKNGVPCAGHEVEIRADAGTFQSGQIGYTDENGAITFCYVPYNESKYKEAGDVNFLVIDLSNSVFVEVNAEMRFTLTLRSKQ